MQLEPVVVHAEATQRARVALLSAWGLSVGYHGGWNATIVFWSRLPDLLLEDPVPVGHVTSQATQLT